MQYRGGVCKITHRFTEEKEKKIEYKSWNSKKQMKELDSKVVRC